MKHFQDYIFTVSFGEPRDNISAPLFWDRFVRALMTVKMTRSINE